MIARHPHLFGNGEKQDWETLKAAEREAAAKRAADAAANGAASPSRPGDEQHVPAPPRVLDGMARGLDPLTKAYRIQQKVAGVGFDWDDHQGPAEKVAEELQEVLDAIEETGDDAEMADNPDEVMQEVGDLLFAAVNLARLAGVHPTTALARANDKFHRRFDTLEQLAGERGVQMQTAGLDSLDRLWDEVKKGEKEEERR
jgi:uncharacterized protein YabN with tetrapyrrole methylase and pyrophosphatase domain